MQGAPETGQKEEDDTASGKVDEVLVTGTYIRNAEPLSPVIVISHDKMVDEGYTRLDQVMEKLPQNFSVFSQTSNAVSLDTNFTGGVPNTAFGSGIDLRGLGPGSTLVLLNGSRLPKTQDGSSVDISAIPLSAIDHVDILTNGASAMYGSDAVGGVVNIVTTKHFRGFESTIGSTSISSGKAPNYLGNVVAGSDWSTGGVVATVGYEKDTVLLAGAREITQGALAPTDLLPKQETASGYIRAQQQLGDRFVVSSDILASTRRYGADESSLGTPLTFRGRVNQYLVSLQLDYRLPSSWSLSLLGSLPHENDSGSQIYPEYGQSADSAYSNSSPSVQVRADGPLFSLTADTIRGALGAEFRQERFQFEFKNRNLSDSTSSLVTPPVSAKRNVSSAFGEILIPLVGSTNAVPLVNRLEVDIAARYDDYSDFGSAFDPKISAKWQLMEGLSFNASYARSFKAPTLFALHGLRSVASTSDIVDPAAPTGTTNGLVLGGANRNLSAERSTSRDVSVNYKPVFATDLDLTLDWFDITYRDKIASLDSAGFVYTNVILDAPILGPAVTVNPTRAQIDAALAAPGLFVVEPLDVTSVGVIADLGYQNVGSNKIQGLDGAVHYRHHTDSGAVSIDLSAVYFDRYEIRVTPTSVEAPGVGLAYRPTKFRSNLVVGWSTKSWSVNARANYAAGYHNPYDIACSPNACPVISWLTVDTSASYTLFSEATASLFQGLRIALSVSNITDRKPPFVYNPANPGLNFDPTNANALGRALALTLTKRWGEGRQ